MKYDTRKIDAMVAEKVMGFAVRWMVHYGSQWTSHFDTYEQAQADADERCRIEPDALCYSTDPAAMMEVLGVFAGKNIGMNYLLPGHPKGGGWHAWVPFPEEVQSQGLHESAWHAHGCETPMMAFAIAALRAVGVPESEIDKAKEEG